MDELKACLSKHISDMDFLAICPFLFNAFCLPGFVITVT